MDLNLKTHNEAGEEITNMPEIFGFEDDKDGIDAIIAPVLGKMKHVDDFTYDQAIKDVAEGCETPEQLAAACYYLGLYYQRNTQGDEIHAAFRSTLKKSVMGGSFGNGGSGGFIDFLLNARK